MGRQHYPGSGWYNGKVSSIRQKAPGDDTLIYTIRYDDGDEEELYAEHLSDVLVGRHLNDETFYTLSQFVHLWESLAPEMVEKSSVIRRANMALGPQDVGAKDSSEFVQHNAQYGRIMPEATDVSNVFCNGESGIVSLVDSFRDTHPDIVLTLWVTENLSNFTIEKRRPILGHWTWARKYVLSGSLHHWLQHQGH